MALTDVTWGRLHRSCHVSSTRVAFGAFCLDVSLPTTGFSTKPLTVQLFIGEQISQPGWGDKNSSPWTISSEGFGKAACGSSAGPTRPEMVLGELGERPSGNHGEMLAADAADADLDVVKTVLGYYFGW